MSQTIPPQQPIDDSMPNVPPAGDVEKVYFEGTPMLRGELMFTTFWVVLGILILAAPGAWMYFKGTENTPWWAWLIAVLLAAAVILVPILTIKRTRYRISNYRIDREIGLLSKKIETLELWHVEDIQFYQSLGDRLLRVGTITVISHDDTTPRLELRSLPSPRPLFETLKNRVIAVKRQRGVIKLDGGGFSGPGMGG